MAGKAEVLDPDSVVHYGHDKSTVLDARSHADLAALGGELRGVFQKVCHRALQPSEVTLRSVTRSLECNGQTLVL